MQTPQVFIAYTPRGAGLSCALAYRRTPRDVCGWFIGARNGDSVANYFLIDDFEHPSQTRFLATGDPFLGWTNEYAPAALALDPPARLADALCHELVRLQDAFRHEWLCYRSDPAAVAEFDHYAQGELAAGDVAIRFHRLARFSRLEPTWTFYSPKCENPVVGYLLRHGPLDYRGE